MQLLINHGLEVNKIKKKGFFKKQLIEHYSVETLNTLLNKYPNFFNEVNDNQLMLFFAIQGDSIEKVQFLIEHNDHSSIDSSLLTEAYKSRCYSSGATLFKLILKLLKPDQLNDEIIEMAVEKMIEKNSIEILDILEEIGCFVQLYLKKICEELMKQTQKRLSLYERHELIRSIDTYDSREINNELKRSKLYIIHIIKIIQNKKPDIKPESFSPMIIASKYKRYDVMEYLLDGNFYKENELIDALPHLMIRGIQNSSLIIEKMIEKIQRNDYYMKYPPSFSLLKKTTSKQLN